MPRITTVVAYLAYLAACHPVHPRAAPPDLVAHEVIALADRYVEEYFDAFPEQALAAGAPDRHPDQLTDNTLAALGRWHAREDALRTELRRLDVSSLAGRPEAITYAFLDETLRLSQQSRICRRELWNVNATWVSWQASMSALADQVETSTDARRAQAYARFAHLPAYLDAEIDNLREGLRVGYTAPKPNVRAAIAQMDAMLAAPTAASPFARIGGPEAPSSFRHQMEALETEKIRPAIARYREFLVQTYLPAARGAVGVAANPQGAACYAAAVEEHATVAMTPQAVHDLGLHEIERIEAELRVLGTRSFAISDPRAVLALIRSDPRYRFAGRDDVLARAEHAVARARAALPRWFGHLPKADVAVAPYPAHLEVAAPPGQYLPPTADGKPGTYYINAYNATEQSAAALEATTFHEANPGHHLQGAIALENTHLHSVQRYVFFSGFGEGWGLYSERLADEMGLYSSDVDRVGMLANQAHRAARLVVDSGLHALGWTRDQAIDYMLAHTLLTRTLAEAEIDRYLAVPGQATAYMIGNLEILRLRDHARRELGGRFDIRAFHDVMLDDGTLPLAVLRAKVDRWIAAERSAPR